MTPAKAKALLVALGSALLTAAPYLPPGWSVAAAAVGGLLGGAALLRRPGDVRVVDVGKVAVPK